MDIETLQAERTRLQAQILSIDTEHQDAPDADRETFARQRAKMITRLGEVETEIQNWEA